MKLLFDENLSPNLVRLLADVFPNSVHVRDVGLEAAGDPIIWKYAQEQAGGKLVAMTGDGTNDSHKNKTNGPPTHANNTNNSS